MKVFDKYNIKSRAIDRIAHAVRRYAPAGVEFTDSYEDADLFIIYAWGRLHHLEIDIENLKKMNKKYVIIQIGVRATRDPATASWLPFWRDANLVWSYLDLRDYCKKDGTHPEFNFYYAPLGIDDDFKKTPAEKKYIIASSGLGYFTESARECMLAAERVKKRVFHVGPVITHQHDLDFSDGMSDIELAKKYSQCEFVSGLRRCEGFELPIIEGLVCGARPIVFDRHDNHHWFEKLVVFIPETSRDGIVDNLIKVFTKGANPVSKEEINTTKKFFNWEKIVKGFWQRI